MTTDSHPSLLGGAQPRIPIGGRIRPGIKVLTKEAAKAKDAQAIYDAGVKAGKSWDEIELEIRNQCNYNKKSPLTPRNVPYFHVKRADFTDPETADLIQQLYASDDGQIYRLPVIFPMDDWLSVMPHGLKAWSANELIYWSEYRPDGTRMCMTRQDMPMVGQGRSRRAQRPFGGRPSIPRPNTPDYQQDGRCMPDMCPQYQSGECNLAGQVIFYVPGIPGASAIALPLTSFYGLDDIRAKLQLVSYLTGGKISGTFGGHTIFYLTKKQQKISMIDPQTGKAKRVKQWITVLEANVELVKMLGQEQTALPGTEPVAMLEHGQSEPMNTTNTTEPEGSDPSSAQQVKLLRQELHQLLNEYGIDAQTFASHAAGQWGATWSREAELLQHAIQDVKSNQGSQDYLRAIGQTIAGSQDAESVDLQGEDAVEDDAGIENEDDEGEPDDIPFN